MPPSSSRSPRRKRVRRYLSATGTLWSGRATSSSSNPKRRRGSVASTSGRFTPPRGRSDVSDSEDDLELDDAVSIDSHPESFGLLLQSHDNRPPFAYSSLPATPITSSPRPESPPPPRLLAAPFQRDDHELPPKHEDVSGAPPFSLWDYLREELLATDFDSHQELKWERVSNFLSMPVAIEKVCLRCTPTVFAIYMF